VLALTLSLILRQIDDDGGIQFDPHLEFIAVETLPVIQADEEDENDIPQATEA